MSTSKDNPCVRCGMCCRMTVCDMGIAHGGDDSHPCRFLDGDAVQGYACQLYHLPEAKQVIKAGTGCPFPPDVRALLERGVQQLEELRSRV